MNQDTTLQPDSILDQDNTPKGPYEPNTKVVVDGKTYRVTKYGFLDKRGKNVSKGFHGKKGRSGRPTLAKQIMKQGVIDASWETLSKVLKNKNTDDKTKVAIALRLAEKTIPQQIDHTTGGQPLILPVDIINKNNITTGKTDEEENY